MLHKPNPVNAGNIEISENNAKLSGRLSAANGPVIDPLLYSAETIGVKGHRGLLSRLP